MTFYLEIIFCCYCLYLSFWEAVLLTFTLIYLVQPEGRNRNKRRTVFARFLSGLKQGAEENNPNEEMQLKVSQKRLYVFLDECDFTNANTIICADLRLRKYKFNLTIPRNIIIFSMSLVWITISFKTKLH